MDNLVYEDDPSPGPGTYWIGYTQLILPSLAIFAVLMIFIYSFDWGWIFDHSWLFAVIYSPVFVYVWVRQPRKYQILDSRIRILLQRPFHYDIPFADIDRAGEGEEPGVWFHVAVNLITAIGQNNIYIVRIKKGANVNITPNNPKLFVENLRKALKEWKRYNIQV
jgi:hypothetical protein